MWKWSGDTRIFDLALWNLGNAFFWLQCRTCKHSDQVGAKRKMSSTVLCVGCGTDVMKKTADHRNLNSDCSNKVAIYGKTSSLPKLARRLS